MDQFMCYVCGMASTNEINIKEHMNREHNIKTGEKDSNDIFVCSLCSCKVSNMGDFKNHMKTIHSKEDWNWWTEEVKVIFMCEECEIEFSEKSMLRNHKEKDHKKNNITDFQDKVQKIEPDNEFLTKNTKDLEAMLKNLPKDAFYAGEEVFQEDFKLILNQKEDDKQAKSESKLICGGCSFKASSKKVLNIHHKFVHDQSFHSCDVCQIRTKTIDGMKVHKWSAHKSIMTYKKTGRPTEKIEVKSEPDITDTSETDYETAESESNDLPDLYEEKVWESGHNFRSRAPLFAKAASGLKILLRKNFNEKNVGNKKIRVLDVRKKGLGKLAEIEITDREGAGLVQLQYLGPNKGNKFVTVQITKSSKDDIRHVQILANEVIKPLLDKLLKGETVKKLNKSFFVNAESIKVKIDSFDCPICSRTFDMERGIKTHITRMHSYENGIKRKEEYKTDTDSNESDLDKTVIKCDRCSFMTVNKTKFKKHKKKPHVSVSVSPIRKKVKLTSHELSKSIVEDIICQIQDTDETEAETDKELKKMETVSFEENRIDDQIMDAKTEEKRLSDQNDHNIARKQRILEEEEVENKKELERNLDILKSQNAPKRQREISIKSKRKRKPASIVEKHANFKPIPSNLRKHFPADHVIMRMNPDGLCGVSCGSTHIFAQPEHGRDLRRKMNKHMVLHWEYYKNKMEFPYERQVGVSGKTAKFTDPQEFQDFLQTPSADYLWTDSEEIQSMCNMFQMTTRIVSVSDNNNDSPTIHQVGPDPDILKLELPNTVEIAARVVPDMYLLLQGAHFDLAVSRESMNEKYSTKDGYNAEEEEEDEPPRDGPKTTEDKLKDLEEKYAELKLNYVDSLKEIKTLKAKLKKVDTEPRKTCEESNTDDLEEDSNIVKSKSKGFRKTSPQSAPESQFKCPVCKFTFIKEAVLSKHTNTHDKDGDWTCGECSYQTMTKKDLEDHKNKAHRQHKRPIGLNVTPVKQSRHLPVSPVRKRLNQINGERATTCTKCDKDFVYSIDLT